MYSFITDAFINFFFKDLTASPVAGVPEFTTSLLRVNYILEGTQSLNCI
jgi:hypothetical protein